MTPVPEMKLYSGYHMETRAASYAWLNLDSLRLAKMDVSSQISIQRRRNELEILVDAGDLFFNIKEPLKEDETLDIRTGNMAVGIRGTCGWVEVPEGADTMRVYLLEGKVLCETDEGGWDVVRAGEMAVMTEDGEIAISNFAVQDIPAFVLEELEEDGELRAKVLEASGLDVTDPDSGPEPSDVEGAEEPSDVEAEEEQPQLSETEEALEQYRLILQQAGSYGYGAVTPGDEYRYALVQMYAGDRVPTLLLSQRDMYDQYGGIENVRIFRYDPDSKVVYQPEESIRTGVASAGGFRGSIDVDGSGGGLWYVEVISSGTGDTEVSLVTVNEDTLHVDQQWRGRLDRIPGEIVREPVEWYEWEDMSGFDSWEFEADAGFSLGASGAGGAGSPDGTETADGSMAEETTAAEATTLAELATAESGEGTSPAVDDTSPAETTAAVQSSGAGVLAAYAGTYTLSQGYSAYGSYLGGQSVTLGADGTVTGGRTSGIAPSSVAQNADGSILIKISMSDGYAHEYTLFPAGCAAAPSGTDTSNASLRYIEYGITGTEGNDGGVMAVIYYKS